MLRIHHAVSLLLSGRAEVHSVQLGVLVGLLAALLWPRHRDAGVALLAASVAVGIWRVAYPWGASGLIVTLPLYFFLPLGLSTGVGVASYRRLRRWAHSSAPPAIAAIILGPEAR